MKMKLTSQMPMPAALWLAACIACMWMNGQTRAQGFATTTVQGTVYLANGQPGSGVLQLAWPTFTTANNQAVTAGHTNVAIGADGYVSVKLAPNQGASPAGLYYTAVYHLSDGTTSTEYWVVPAAAQASLSQLRAQVMPAAQAVQAVSKGYVDQSITELTQSLLTASGGSLSVPLFLNGDPSQPTQAATKRYVDNEFANALPISGGATSGPLTGVQLGAAYQVDQFPGADFGEKLQACLNRLDAAYGGTCDARNFTGTQAIGSSIEIATANATVQLPCATIATSHQIRITAATRNVTFHGCSLRGASTASGSKGGTVLLYSGTGPMIQVGDPTYAADTPGFHLDNVVINITPATDAAAQALAAYRTQELDLEGLYLLGNSNQTGLTLDGTANYTGGTFQDLEFNGFGTALNAVGHQVPNVAPTDWVNASTFVRLHINCPTNSGSPISGTYGINLLQGDGNTFTGGDVEGCGTALHLGSNAQNNTIVGLRNENSLKQVAADAGSSYNNWITGGTIFTGQLTDNGTRNSFLDTFHRSFNGLNGDWYGSQADATITNHYRVGTGAGNERGLLDRYQSDFGYRWTTGLSDATAGEQFYQVLDELNNVNRLSIGQYNHGQASTNNQTALNAAGTGAVVLNGSANSGTGGVIFGSGGATGSTVATINNAGNAQFNGTLQVGGASTFTNSTTVKNQADAEIDSVLWAGTTANQKESFIYKDYLGASQWYMVKDASNNWALNSATGGLDSFKAYQSNNSGDTYINASNATGHIRLNYEPGSGSETDIYSGPSSTLVAAFLGSNSIKFPGLSAASGRNCLQIDNSGYLSNTGTACGSGGGVNGTVNAGNAGQVAYYASNGTVIGGTTSVAVTAGGTGATTAVEALRNLGAQAAMAGVAADAASGMIVSGNIMMGASLPSLTPYADVRHPRYGAICNTTADDTSAIQAAITAAGGTGGSGVVYIPDNCHMANGSGLTTPNGAIQITLNLQGTLKVDSTFVLPRGVDLVCLSKGPKPQFATGSPTCVVQVANVYGTLGTAVTSTNTAVTVTPSFVGGSAANLVPNSAITIAAPMTCGTTGATRTALAGTYPGAGPTNTVYSIGTCTDASGNAINFRIPPASRITVTGCSDTSFNTPTGGLFSSTADFPGLTLGTRMVGSAATVSDTSCVISGFNLDSFETVRIESVSSGTATIHTNHTHAATDKFGMVGMSGTFNDLSHKLIQGVSVTGNFGAGYWADANSMMRFESVSFTGYQYLTSIPMMLSSSWGWTFERSQTTSYSGYTCPTVSFNCGEIGPPFDVMMDLLPQSLFSENAVGGGIWGPNSTISHGMYITTGPYLTGYETGPVINNSVIEQPMWNGITFDSRNTGAIYQTSIEDSLIQDNLVGWSTAAWVGHTDNGATRRGQIAFYNNLNLAYGPTGLQQTVNKYFCGEISVNGASGYNALVWPACPQATVTINDGRNFVGEVNTPPMGLSYIPYPTKAVGVDPTTWGCTNVSGSGCTVTAGKLAPDGTTTAGEIFAGTGFGQTQISSGSFSTAAGDVLLYGVWTRCTDGRAAGNIKLQTFGTDSFDTISGGYGPAVQNMFWHAAVNMSIVKVGQAGNHTINFYLTPNDSAAGTTCQFWQPFVVHVPASAGVPIDEIQRFRTEAMHGYVPSNLPVGQVMALSGAAKLYWATDVNLYRGTETATVTNVAVTSGTATITAANHFYGGEWVSFSGVGTNTWLNTFQPIQIATASGTQFTFATTHANVTSAPDTGTATIGELKTDLTMDAKAYKVNGSYGTAGQVLQSTGNGSQWVNGSASEPGNTYDFSLSAATGGISCTGTNPYTCTLPPICNLIRYDIMSGGSGGGSGATATNVANGFGGGGGAAGEVQNGVVPCTFFGGPSATIVVTVGAGGNGGAAQSGTSASGNNGAGGFLSKVSGPSGYGAITSSGGNGASYGAGGTATTGTGGAQNPNYGMTAVCPGTTGSSGTGGTQICQSAQTVSAGGAGGGGVAAGTASSGGAQSTSSNGQSLRGPAYAAASVTGGTVGNPGQTPTYNVTPLTLFLYSALGGTGGGGSCAANGGDGGDGMEPGGGGGGGGAACNGFSSGKGGKGGPGHVRLIIE
jgi:hypothetical protein